MLQNLKYHYAFEEFEYFDKCQFVALRWIVWIVDIFPRTEKINKYTFIPRAINPRHVETIMLERWKVCEWMSRILCPECGTKISDKATKCPHCGFQSADPSRPISEQDKYEMVPIFEYEIEEWKPNRDDLTVISYENNKSLIQYFGKWETIQKKLPAIAEVRIIFARAGFTGAPAPARALCPDHPHSRDFYLSSSSRSFPLHLI